MSATTTTAPAKGRQFHLGRLLLEGRAFFALIAAGGTLGAIVGPWLASQLAEPLGTPNLLLLAGFFLLAARLEQLLSVARVGTVRAVGLALST